MCRGDTSRVMHAAISDAFRLHTDRRTGQRLDRNWTESGQTEHGGAVGRSVVASGQSRTGAGHILLDAAVSAVDFHPFLFPFHAPLSPRGRIVPLPKRLDDANVTPFSSFPSSPGNASSLRSFLLMSLL